MAFAFSGADTTSKRTSGKLSVGAGPSSSSSSWPLPGSRVTGLEAGGGFESTGAVPSSPPSARGSSG